MVILKFTLEKLLSVLFVIRSTFLNASFSQVTVNLKHLEKVHEIWPEQKVVLITGAAGGIGAATAREFYALGANLVLTDMQQEAVDKLASEFEASRVLPLALDVTDAVATKM